MHHHRIHVTEVDKGLTVSLPAPRRYLVMLVLVLLLPLWGAGLWVTAQAAFRHAPGNALALVFLLLWFAGWMLSGLCGFVALLWMMLGREMITVREATLTIRREVRGVGRGRDFRLAGIAGLRAVPDTAGLYEMATSLRLFGFGGGRIAFDYLGLSEQCGAGISDAEARQVIAILQERLAPPRPTGE